MRTRNARYFQVATVWLLIQVLPQMAGAWGFTGHQLIAHLAQQRLSPQALAGLKNTLGNASIEEAASWPDSLRDDPTWRHTKSYHFKNIARELSYFSQLEALPPHVRKRGDVVMALLAAEEVLGRAGTSPELRKKVLAFYVHFFADLHQPLHVGYRHDLGGNIVRLDWYGVATNLHSLWDRHLLGSLIFREFPADVPRPIPTETIAAKLLSLETWPEDSFRDASYLRWLEEILVLRDKTYEGLEKTNDEYYALHVGTLRRQILLAADRLARKLEKIFSGQAPISTENLKLREQILQVLPASSMTTVIDFQARPQAADVPPPVIESRFDEHEMECDHGHGDS